MTHLVVIVGPTGAGKTALALALAEAAGAEIVSCDSQQVYTGMDIGTGKATAAERAHIPHHLIDVVRPDDEMTAAWFVRLADAAIADLAGRGKPVVVCGGTGLYVRALLLGLFEGPAADPVLRAELDLVPPADLWPRLAAVDPDLAARTQPNDRKRILRGLEVFAATGVPLSEHQRRHDHRTVAPRYPHRFVGLAPPRDRLYASIDTRVEAMFAAGLVDEVRGLRAAGYQPPLRSQQAIGYGEVHDHLVGRSNLSRAVELVKRNSRHYARRQLTWYRPEESVAWAQDPADVDLVALAQYLTDPT